MAAPGNDKLAHYRAIARQVVSEYAKDKLAYGQVTTEAVTDDEHGHYVVIHVGWDNRGRRVYGPVIHLDVINGKLWIQHDSTDWPVADALLAAGVPQSDIVLGFQPAEVRAYLEFAAA